MVGDGFRWHLSVMCGGYKASPEIFWFSLGEEPGSEWNILGGCGVGNTRTMESDGFQRFEKKPFDFFKTS